jgi:hypothetical protein
METIDKFTFRNGAVKKWLVCLFLIAACIALIFPPAFWLAGAGALLIVSGDVHKSYRTDQWNTWENEGSMNWFEGWAASSGVVLLATPLVFALMRWLLQALNSSK